MITEYWKAFGDGVFALVIIIILFNIAKLMLDLYIEKKIEKGKKK